MFETLTVPSIAPCPIGRILETIEKGDRANLESALQLDLKTVSNSLISREIRRELGVAVAPETISAHRKGECRCVR